MMFHHSVRPASTRFLGVALAAVGVLGIVGVTAAASERGSPAPICAPVSAALPTASGGPFTLSVSTARVGCIQLTVSGASSAPVTITETGQSASTGAPVGVLAPTEGRATLPDGRQWQCDQRNRAFQAVEELPDGSTQTASTSVTTPSCADRLAVSIPGTRLHRGYPITLAIRDRWRLGGLLVRACQADQAPRECAAIELKPGSVAGVLRLRAAAGGRPLLEIFDPYQRIRRRLGVLDSRPLMLATGDSEMQVLDELLASDLAGVGGMRVVGDAKQSTAISSPFFFDWPAHAVSQVEDLHPDVVAMFLGGNEGFALGQAGCCGEAWSRAYAGRVAGMMRLYRQEGAATVYWFLIPTPSSEPFVRVVRAVNRGILLAASEFRGGVHVFDLRPIFSPGGRYIDSLTYHGHTITVHEPDGFHLSTEADHIVAGLFIDRLRRDGLIP